MSGEKDLGKLLAGLSPILLAGEYVFCTFETASYGDRPDLEPVGAVLESEGLTLVIPKTKADEHGIPYESAYRCITLNIHSSLDAVGLTAIVSTKLAEFGISANVLAGYFHDHIFVQSQLAEKAIEAINNLSS
jgi:hypothetical protein